MAGKVTYYNGKRYSSLTQLAECYGISPSTLRARLYRGYSLEEALNTNKYCNSISVEYGGKGYSSIREFCDDLGLNYGTVGHLWRSGMSLEDIVEHLSKASTSIPVEYKGKKYRSLTQLGKAYNIHVTTLLGRLNRGMSLEEALQQKIMKVVYGNRKFRSLREFAEEYNLNYSTVCNLRCQGLTLDEIVRRSENLKHYRKSVVYNGRKYKSLAQLAREYGIHEGTLSLRLEKGVTLEDALKKPSRPSRVYVYQGKEYKSIAELSRVTKVKTETLTAKLKAGLSVDEAVKASTPRKVVGGVGLRALAHKAGISHECLRQRLNKGYSLHEALTLPKYNKK